jgi:hypothetical protein
VPVTINVNNGELMAQLIETRESLAEVKAQQSAIRQDQRVFSYQVHKDGADSTEFVDAASAPVQSAAVGANSSESESSNQSEVNASRAVGRVVSQKKDQTAESSQKSSAANRQGASEVRSASKQTEGRSTVRMRSISETSDSRQMTAGRTATLSSGTGSSETESVRNLESAHAPDTVEAAEASREVELETSRESSTTTEDSAFSIEEEISFEPISPPATPPAEESDDSEATSVPVIEPISYNVEETVEESSRVSVQEETVVQFAPLDEAAAAEVPAALPELSFAEQQPEKSAELPVLSLDQEASARESRRSAVAVSEETVIDPGLPEIFADKENAVATKNSVVAVESQELKRVAGSTRTREQLSSAFAAVRGLPPEDLFGDRSTPFVTPIEPAEPVADDSATKFQLADSAPAGEPITSEHMVETDPPTISFGQPSSDSLVVHPSSAASPVELEFGEPSAPNPALAHSEDPGSPETPVMPLAEQKPERWHKYRSRIYLKQNSAPSTPVPPVPEIASTEVPEVPLTPVPAPPALETELESSLAESSEANVDRNRTVTDSPLMIPDEDGTTEIAKNIESEKLGSSAMPPFPELAAVPQLAPVPDLQMPMESAQTVGSPVYEPQPVMDRLHEVTTEMSTPPVFSSPPMMAERRMPQKSAKKLPFETTFRRINKRVAWLADAMSPSENKGSQPKSMKPQSSPPARPQYGSHPPTQSNGPAVARKSAPQSPMQLPKLNVPRFTVQKFSLPNVNFRAIQAPSVQMPMLDTPDWLACPPDLMAPVRNSTAVHRVISTMQFAGQPNALK